MTTHKLVGRDVALRGRGLLDMLYTPKELAGELEVTTRRVYQYIESGLPCQYETAGETEHVWLHGLTVRAWLQAEVRRKPAKQPLAGGEAFCGHCKAPRWMVNPQRVPHGKFVMLKGTCQVCGARMTRSARKEPGE